MPCVNDVMEAHDKQIKLTAFFLERKLVNPSDLTEHDRRVKSSCRLFYSNRLSMVEVDLCFHVFRSCFYVFYYLLYFIFSVRLFVILSVKGAV